MRCLGNDEKLQQTTNIKLL